jgi:hypothetical protein
MINSWWKAIGKEQLFMVLATGSVFFLILSDSGYFKTALLAALVVNAICFLYAICIDDFAFELKTAASVALAATAPCFLFFYFEIGSGILATIVSLVLFIFTLLYTTGVDMPYRLNGSTILISYVAQYLLIFVPITGKALAWW